MSSASEQYFATNDVWFESDESKELWGKVVSRALAVNLTVESDRHRNHSTLPGRLHRRRLHEMRRRTAINGGE